VNAHQDDKKPYKELDIWGHLNCDADNMAEKFWKLMDSGNVKALKQGFFMDSMEVGIMVNGVVMLYMLHQTITLPLFMEPINLSQKVFSFRVNDNLASLHSVNDNLTSLHST
jgi:hypothetical protein